MKVVNILSILLFICSFQTLFAQSIQDYIKENKLQTKQSYELDYTVDKKGKGDFAQKGDYVKIIYKGQLLDGSVFDKATKDKPFVFQVGYGQVIRGMDLGLTLFKAKSRGKLFIPAELAYGKSGVGKTIPPNASLLFELEVLEILSPEAYDEYMIALEKKEREAFEEQKKAQYKTDLKRIHEYAAQQKWKVTRTKSGLSYVITKKGKGKAPKKGNLLKVKYEGYLLDGTLFDKSPKKKPYRVTLGEHKVISGWEEGLPFFKKNAEGWLLLPSHLAYGPLPIEEEEITIPANSVLIFKVKVTDVD